MSSTSYRIVVGWGADKVQSGHVLAVLLFKKECRQMVDLQLKPVCAGTDHHPSLADCDLRLSSL